MRVSPAVRSRPGVAVPQPRPLAQVASEPPEATWAFFIASAFYLAVSWFYMFGRHIYVGDSLSRTANGYVVVYSRDPHLAAIGFVWNPLPSLLQIPVLALLKPLGVQVFAGNVMSALCAAATLPLLYSFFAMFGVVGWPRRLLTAGYALNPMVLMYAVNGASEAPFLICIVGIVHQFVSFVQKRSRGRLVMMAFLVAVAFGIRYEAIPIFGAGLVCLAYLFVARVFQRSQLEGTAVAYAVPFCYVVAMWVGFNYMIMNDPLFFLNGPYSNVAQTIQFRKPGSELYPLYRHVAPSLLYAVQRSALMFPAYLPFLALSVYAQVTAWRRRQAEGEWVGVILIPGSILAFHAYQLYGGQSFGWLRFFMYSIPGAVLLAGPLLRWVHTELRRWQRSATWLIVGAALLSNLSSFYAMSIPDVGKEEAGPLAVFLGRDPGSAQWRSFDEDREAAAYVDAKKDNKLVMLDTFSGFAILLFSRRPQQFAITNDENFQDVVDNPRKHVGYILVRVPRTAIQASDKILTKWPNLADQGEPWAHLEKQFGDWKLWRVDPLPR